MKLEALTRLKAAKADEDLALQYVTEITSISDLKLHSSFDNLIYYYFPESYFEHVVSSVTRHLGKPERLPTSPVYAESYKWTLDRYRAVIVANNLHVPTRCGIMLVDTTPVNKEPKSFWEL